MATAQQPSTTFKRGQAQPPKTAGTAGGTTGASNLWFTPKKVETNKQIKSQKQTTKLFKVIETFNIEGTKYSLVKEADNKYYIETSKVFDFMTAPKSKTQSMTKNQAIIKFNDIKTKDRKIKFKLN